MDEGKAAPLVVAARVVLGLRRGDGCQVRLCSKKRGYSAYSASVSPCASRSRALQIKFGFAVLEDHLPV